MVYGLPLITLRSISSHFNGPTKRLSKMGRRARTTGWGFRSSESKREKKVSFVNKP